MKKMIAFMVFLLCIAPLISFAASLSLTAPNYLPRNTTCVYYSPEVRIDYSGLENQKYTLRIWLLESPRLDPSPDCGSGIGCEAGFCPRVIPIDNSNGGSSSGFISIVENFDVYNYSQFDWVVRLYKENGSQAAWTEQYTNGISNRAPKLNNIGDKTGYVGQLLEFEVSGSDSDGNDLSYSAFDIPSGASFDSGTGKFSWTPSATGTFSNIKFRVTDDGEGGLYDDEVITITIDECSFPSSPSTPSPSNGDSNVDIGSPFCWNESDNAASYEIFLGTTCPPQSVEISTSTCFTPSSLDTDTTYYWYILAQNDCGESRGPESGCWSFTTTCNQPEAPSTPDPKIGTSDVSIVYTLGWADIEGADSYNVYLGNTSPSISLIGNTTISNFSPDTLEYENTYYWKVEAVNSCGAIEGAEWNFTTQCGPPSAADSPSPKNKIRGIAINSITLDWEDNDRVTSYEVYFGTSLPLTLLGTTTTSNHDLSTLFYNTLDI